MKSSTPTITILSLTTLVVFSSIAPAQDASIRPAPSLAPDTVPPATPYKGCVKIFDGKSFEGWEADPSTWSIVDGAMRGVGGSSRLAFTKADYGSFRLIFTARMNPVNGDHLGVLFWGDRPQDAAKPKIDNAGWLQFMPPFGGMWNYHPPQHQNLPHETLVKVPSDSAKWSTAEILCNLEKGTMRAAVDGVEIVRYAHPTASERENPEKRIIPGPIGMFRHGGGASEYKDIYVEANPKEDKLLTADAAPKTAKPSSMPCMDVLHLFTAPGVPAFAPSEIAVPELPANGFVRPGLPGGGLERHPMLYVGENYNKMFLVKDGKVIWTYATGPRPEFDDVWMMSNGNILFSRMQYVAVISPDKKVLWRYDAVTSKDAKQTEIHACQPIGLDKVMFVENGLPPRLKVINIKTGAVEVDHELPFEEKRGVHPQFRRARVTAQGTYLISFLGLGRVVEYDKDFKEIWKYEIPMPWAAIRLKNGNTLITNEKDSLTREVNPKGETVWEFNCLSDLPAEYQFTSAPQSCTRLANGNTIFTSRGKGGDGPQLIEVTPDKKVVWVLQDWKTLGDATAVQILNDPGIPEVPGESEH